MSILSYNTELSFNQLNQSHILIVDSDENVRRPLQIKLRSQGYACQVTDNSDEAIRALESEKIDIVILDTDTEKISIFKLLSFVKDKYPYTSVIVATPVGGTNVGIDCLKLGADEHISKPFILEEVVLIISRVLEKSRVDLIKTEFQQTLQDIVGKQAEKIRDLSFQAVTALAHALEAKDKYTAGHSQRVAKISVAMSKFMGLPESSIEKIQMAGLVHDIGKIGVKDIILNKPAYLTIEELRHVRCHPEIGEHILAPIINDVSLLKLVRNHHEHYDGAGYPDGLMTDQIPLETRIMTVADAYDAMTSERPYRKAMNEKLALVELEQKQGTQFDPEVVAVFHRLHEGNLWPRQEAGLLRTG